MQVLIVPPYDLPACSQVVSNAELFDRLKKVVRQTCSNTSSLLLNHVPLVSYKLEIKIFHSANGRLLCYPVADTMTMCRARPALSERGVCLSCEPFQTKY
jgi:hypothetical protein